MAARSEWEKMVEGEIYDAYAPELVEGRKRARGLLRRYNASTEEQGPHRLDLLKELFGSIGARLEVEPPFRCDYGTNIHAGDGVYMNFDCLILDCAEVRIGRNVMFGPGVHVYAACHPVEAEIRIQGPEFARPVTIGDNVWIGGRSVICPGVTIGANTTIGAGSVVTRDIPANVVAAGNPCRVIRSL
ncbi:MAG TPA: sugar O-acetyltransferase [Pantanalinema sp.]